MISVIIPTVDGREEHLARCEAAYEAHTPDLETIILRNYETCGEAWQVGAGAAEGEYLHWTADDLEPHAGWAEAAIATTQLYAVPAPVIYTAERIETDGGLAGEFESCGGVTWLTTDGMPALNITAIPFCSREQWANIGPHLPIHYFCVPTDHRILTYRGWRFYDELVVGEPVMSFHPVTHEMKWEPLEAVNVFPYQGELMVIERKGERFEFTPDHRWPVVTNLGQRGMVDGRGLRTHHRLPIRGDFQGAKSILSPRHAAILGWVVGDGSYVRRRDGYTQMVVYQSERKFLKHIEDLLGRTAPPSRIGTDVATVAVLPEDKYAIEEVFDGKHSLKEIVPQLSRAAADAMLDALFMAEGSTTAAGGRVIGQSRSANPEVREAVQILALMTGSNASLNAEGIFLKTSRAISLQHCGIGSMPYEGKVWCPRTATGTWIMEHEGGAIPTGNSDNWFTHRAQRAGYGVLVNHAYLFTHHWAKSGRGAGMTEPERMEYDRRQFEYAVRADV